MIGSWAVSVIKNRKYKRKFAHFLIQGTLPACGRKTELICVEKDWDPKDHPDILLCPQCLEWHNTLNKPIQVSGTVTEP